MTLSLRLAPVESSEALDQPIVRCTNENQSGNKWNDANAAMNLSMVFDKMRRQHKTHQLNQSHGHAQQTKEINP